MITDRRGVAAVEFALVAPVMLLLAFGAYDLVVATTTLWHLTEAVKAVGQIATSSAANTNNTNSLTATEAYNAATAAYRLVPQMAASGAVFGVVLTSVVFTPTVANCTSSCLYTAAVAWSHTLLGSAAARSCSALTSVADSASPSAGTLPVDAFSSAPLLVVDVSYTFNPLSQNSTFTFLHVSIPMVRTGYLPLRTGTDASWVSYSGSSNAMCAGYH